jgi:hypothetical protein
MDEFMLLAVLLKHNMCQIPNFTVFACAVVVLLAGLLTWVHAAGTPVESPTHAHSTNPWCVVVVLLAGLLPRFHDEVMLLALWRSTHAHPST